MATNPFIGTIQIKGKTTSEWEALDPVLLAREPALDLTTGLVKYGNGVDRWSQIPYPPGAETTAVVNDLVTSSTTAALAAAQGVILNNSVAAAATSAATAAATATAASANAATATTAANAATAAVVSKANLVGGATFSGGAVIVPTPSAPTHATTKGYVDAAVASVGSGFPTTTTFAQAIPFDGYRSMGETTVSGALAFTVDTTGAVDAGETILSLVADASHTPTFATNISLAGTQGYDNTLGRVNNITFFREFSRYYYGVILGPIVTVPTLLTAAVSNSTPTRVDLVWSQPMSSTISAAAAFTVSGHTVSAHTYVDSTHTYLTVSSGFTNGETARTLAYTQPGSNKMTDAFSGFLVVSFSGTAITNNVADVTAPTLTSATVQNGAATIVEVVFSEILAGYPTSGNLPAYTSFTVSGHTVSAIAWGTSAAMVKLTVDAFVAGETRTLAYTRPGTNNLADASSNQVANFSGSSITDSVSSVSKVRMNVSVGASVTEGGDGTTGWTYTSSANVGIGAGSAQFAYSTKTLALSTDGYLEATFTNTNATGVNRALGFTAEGAGGGMGGTAPYCIVDSTGTYGIMSVFAGSTTTVNGASGRTMVTGDLVRITRTGSNIVAAVSSPADSGVYTTIHTWSGASTAALTGMIGVGLTSNTPTITDPRSIAMA